MLKLIKLHRVLDFKTNSSISNCRIDLLYQFYNLAKLPKTHILMMETYQTQ